MVLQITAPQSSSKALEMTLALVPGGPEPITNGLGSFRPLTVVARVAIRRLLAGAGDLRSDPGGDGPRHRNLPEQSRSGVQGAGQVCRSAPAVPADATDLRKDPGAGASVHSDQSQQPGQPAAVARECRRGSRP